MVDDDPFATPGADRTIIMPSPGGRGRPSSRPNPPDASRPTYDPSAETSNTNSFGGGLNPLSAAANALLVVVPQLRTTLQHPDPQALRDELSQRIREFEGKARAAGVAPEKIIAARYMLCTLLDEAATSTPWGGSGLWARHSLLVSFHGEASGGEKFFQVLSKLAEDPKANRDILELSYVCLALGFQGRYRVQENGASQLETLRERLAQILRKGRGDYERDLSPPWQAAASGRSKVLSIMPLWVSLAACGLITLVTYLSFIYLINGKSDPVYSHIAALRVNTALPSPPPAAQPRLAKFLAPEIRQGLVNVVDEEGRSVVTLLGDGVFTPGSATVSSAFIPTLTRIADALNSVPGKVLITGHTDNVPIRSLRFPSNWYLSRERARAVMQILAEKVTPASRLSAEGRADSEPIASNDTPEGRARNRRVEIAVFVPGNAG
jgi:type VI secretion system protein ImpK